MMGDKNERYNVQDNAKIVLFHASGLSWRRQLKNFSVVILPAFCWSNLFQISGDWGCFGQTKSRSLENVEWLYSSR